MTTKLAIKHKDSLVLKEKKERKSCVIQKQSILKICGLLSFPWITLCVFLVYWFILCPLMWYICCVLSYWSYIWPSYWSFLFWTAAFLIWLVIMCGLVILWKRLQVEQSLKINTISKYGSDNARQPLNVHQQISFADAEYLETKKNWNESKKSDRENPGKDLPPLVIHKQISGENIEDTAGVVRFEEDEKARLSIVGDYAEKSPLQDYLKLVTVSPKEDEVNSPKSPKTPMSPRELFFIDLIREAEKAENAKLLKTRTHFFPSEVTENDNAETLKSIKDEKDTEDVEHQNSIKNVENTTDKKANELKSKRESNYFIADVESPTIEKTEVFLQIDSNESEETASIVEKPVLILQSNETNLQETSTSPN